MVIKGGSRGGGGELAGHLLRADTNEHVEVTELRGVAAETLPAALREMMAMAAGTRCTKPLYHASINPGPSETLTAAQKAHAITTLERRLGLAGHPRAVVKHRKAGRDHIHIVWERIDPDTRRAAHDGFNYRAHEEVARQLEREFGHARVQGAHVERADQPRPARTPPTPEIQQATRTDRDTAGITAEVTALWQAADSGTAFAAALQAAGYVLARGDRRGFCIVDAAGGAHSLARRIAGVKTAEVNARLQDIDLAGLPSVDQARAQVRQQRPIPSSAINKVQEQLPPGASPLQTKCGATLPAVELSRPPGTGKSANLSQAASQGAAAALKPSYTLPTPSPASKPDRWLPAGAGQGRAGSGRSGGKPGGPVGIMLAKPPPSTAARMAMPVRSEGGSAQPRPARAMLGGLGMGRIGGGAAGRAAIPRMLTLFLEPRPMFLPGGRVARPVTPVKSSPPERLNLRRPDGPSAETIGIIQEQIDKLTAYGLATGESTATQVQELRNVLQALLDQAALRAILGPYYQPHHKRQPGG